MSDRVEKFVERYRPEGPVFSISAIAGEGCPQLVRAIAEFLATLPPTDAAPDGEEDQAE